MQRTLSALDLQRDLSIRDLTDPSAGSHALQVLVQQVAASLQALWGCDVLVRRGERIVTIGENYDLLRFSGDVVTRDARYTRYVSELAMLRSHTSAVIPGALGELAQMGVDAPPDVLVVCPGICYRRDAIGRWHTGTPHQLDVWRLRRAPTPDGDRLDETDLGELIGTICKTIVPGRAWRCEPRVHPYTERGRQVDVDWEGSWVEVAECGLAHPEVLRLAGLGEEWSGLALGMGLDRLLMLTKGVPDIRLLRSSDQRVASQMLGLEPYRPASLMPAISRDLSVAVDASDIAEDLGDRVRDALGAEADYVEEVSVLASTPWAELPEVARDRLGMSSEQVNLLVRVVLRALDRTLDDAEANELRDRVYAAIHQGTSYMWAANAGAAASSP